MKQLLNFGPILYFDEMFACTVLVFVLNLVNGQKLPLFLGQSTPAVQARMANSMVSEHPVASRNTFLEPALQPGKWSPGEPIRVFPGSRDEPVNSCQRSGCSGSGMHCVFWGSLCPRDFRGLPCRCQRGCLVDTYFIPFGQSRNMDRCNNVCTCRSREGTPTCTLRNC